MSVMGPPPQEANEGPLDYLKGLLGTAETFIQDNPNLVTGGVGLLGAGLSKILGGNDNNTKPTGYQGGIPDLTYNRQMLQQPVDPNRVPGSGGRRYFTDGEFISNGTMTGDSMAGGIAGAQPAPPTQPVEPPTGENQQLQVFAGGGIADAKQGRYLRGETDGMEDQIPTSIDGSDPAALSHGEFVIPADIVSHLGNGNSDAGAKTLQEMMARIRKERTGNDKQGKQIDANQFLPR